MEGKMRDKIIDIKKAPAFNRGFSNLAEAVLVKLNNQTTDKHTKNNLILVFYCYFYYNKISTNHLFIFHSPDTILA
jgi:hypothetical protein